MRIFVGQPHIGHVHARLEILWILHPLRQILGIVCQHSRSQCFSLSDVRQIWSYLGDSLGITGDAVRRLPGGFGERCSSASTRSAADSGGVGAEGAGAAPIGGFVDRVGDPIAVIDERGGAHRAEDLLAERAERRVAIVCGLGNNGGDGFVIARVLKTEWTRVYVIGDPDTLKGDAKHHYDRLRKERARLPVTVIKSEAEWAEKATEYFSSMAR